MHIAHYWVLQGNPEKQWDRPALLYTDPIVSWSVTGVSKEVEVGDGVVIWIAHRHPDQRGIYAMGKVVGEPRPGYPLDWGSPERRAEPVPCVPLSIFWYVTHNPVTVPELKTSGFASHGILKMPRKTAYACTEAEFHAARDLVQNHGPIPAPARPADAFDFWWNTV